jgi:hypothetical protein
MPALEEEAGFDHPVQQGRVQLRGRGPSFWCAPVRVPALRFHLAPLGGMVERVAA